MPESDDSSAIAPAPPNRGTATRRVITLRAGEYWKATGSLRAKSNPQARGAYLLVPTTAGDPDADVPAGCILLICSIKRIDGEIHTIELAGHPGTHPGWRFRMLVDDFTEAFEHEDTETARATRAREVEEIHQEVRAIEGEMREAQSSPEAVQRMIEEGLALLPPEPATRTLALPLSNINAGEMTLADALQLRPQDWEAQRAAVENQSREARAVAAWMRKHQERIGTTIAKLTPFYSELSAAALAMSEDATQLSNRVQKGLVNLDLYTGKEVEVVTIATGAPASAEHPLVITQARLFCDEELAVWKDVSSDFDFEKLPDFDATLTDERFLDQLFSGPRGVVLMSVRRDRLSYHDMDVWTSAQRNERNTRSWLLVRNGANVHRVYSSVSSMAHAWMLFPTLDDMEGVFRGLDGTRITLESIAYPDHRDQFDSLALHYRRFLLLLCGLDHRLELFGKFYPQDLSNTTAFLTLEFQHQHFRFINDGDPQTQLPDGRPALVDWIKAHNERLQSGSRVLAFWPIAASEDSAPALYERETVATSRRDHGPQRIFTPKRSAEVVIAHRDSGELCAICEASGKYAHTHPTKSGQDRTVQARVVLKNTDSDHGDSFCGWLCLDGVDPDDLRYYVHNRMARKRHSAYVQLFKAAAAWLDKEAAEEKPTREALVKALMDGKVAAELPQAQAIVAEAVVAWRAARRGEGLPKNCAGEAESDGWQSLYRQMWLIAERDANSAVTDAAGRLAAERGRQPLRLVSTGESGALVLYAAPAQDERDDRLVPDKFAVKLRLRRTAAGGLSVESERRVYMLKRPAKEVVLKQWSGEEDWAFEVPPKLRRDAKVDAISRCLMFETSFAATWQPVDAAEWRVRFERVKEAYDQLTGRVVTFPTVLSPLALQLPADQSQSVPIYIGLGASSIDWLRLLAPEDSLRRELLDWIVCRYEHTAKARERHSNVTGCPSFGLYKFYSAVPNEAPYVLSGASHAYGISHPSAHAWDSDRRANYDRLRAGPRDVYLAETLKAYLAELTSSSYRRSSSLGWSIPGVEDEGFFRRVLAKSSLLPVLAADQDRDESEGETQSGDEELQDVGDAGDSAGVPPAQEPIAPAAKRPVTTPRV